MDKILKQILVKLDNLVTKVDELSTLKPKVEELYSIKPKVEELYNLKGKIEESHQWLSALHHNSQLHKAELDQVSHKVAAIEGALLGVAKSLEPFKKAQ